MARAHRSSIAGAVIVGLLITQANTMLFASDATVTAAETPSIALSIAHPMLTDQPSPLFKPMAPEFTASAGQVYRGRARRNRHEGSAAAIIVGAAAAIAGTAVLVYANRPECSTNQFAGGCGYGTKVVGTSVLVGGAVGLFVGAVTW